MKILFICTGNICRSPSAEAILRKMCDDAGYHNWVIDSAGIGNWHAGDAADPRAIKAAAQRGYDMTPIRARSINVNDFSDFDRIYAMTHEHLDFLKTNATDDSSCTLHLFLAACGINEDIPDPYYGKENGFENMMDLLEEGCQRIIDDALSS